MSGKKEDDTIESLLLKINDLLLQSKLTEADRLIEEGFFKLRSLLSSGGSPLDKDILKREVRALATFKLTFKLSFVIAQ